MRNAFGILVVMSCAAAPIVHAQEPQSGRPVTVPGRFGISGGVLKTRVAEGGYLQGFGYLTREDRPLALRADITAAWLPLQSVGSYGQPPTSLSQEMLRLSAGVAALVQLKPKSRVNPYMLVGFRLEERRLRYTDSQNLLNGGWLSPEGAFGFGAGLRVRLGGQVFHLEAVGYKSEYNFSIGMRIPF